MAIYLGHTTARRILESSLVLGLDTHPVRGPINCDATKEEVDALLSGSFSGEDMASLSALFQKIAEPPLDFVVSTHSERRARQGMQFHIHDSHVPESSYLFLASDIMVACPELCFLQLASTLDLIQTIRLAMSFCGIYQLVGDESSESIFDRSPIMTIDSALAFLQSSEGARGIKNARRALRYAIPNAGSPMETSMVLPLYLPHHLGGFGLPRPVMNGEIPVTGLAADILGSVVCRGDALWEQEKFILEFQSREFHDNPVAYGDDYARKLALESMGYEVIFVTRKQIADVNQMTEIAQRLWRRMDRRSRRGLPTPNARTEGLLRAVLT